MKRAKPVPTTRQEPAERASGTPHFSAAGESYTSWLETAIAQAPVSVVITDRDGTILWVNPAFTRITGYPAGEALGNTPRLLKSDAQNAAFYQQLWQTILAGQEWRGDLENRRKDGTLYTQRLLIAPVSDSEGQVSGFVGIGEDVSQRKRAEDELRASEHRYSRLVENVNDAIIMDDVEGRLIFANRRFREWFGLEGEDVRNVVFEDFIAPEDRKRVRDFHDRRVRGKRVPERFEFEGVRADGSRILLEALVTAIPSGGRIVGTHSALRDVTDRKRAENALRQSEERLRALLEGLPDQIFVIDRRGELLDCHAPKGSALLIDSDLCSSGILWNALPAGLQIAFRATVTLALNSQRTQSLDFSLDSDSGIRHWEARVVPMADESLTIVAREVTRTRETERRLKDILTHSTNLFYSHTPDHRLVYVSPQSQHFFDCEPEDAMVAWTDFITDHPANRVGLDRTIKAIETGKPQPPYELEIETRKGRRLWVEVNEAPIRAGATTVAIVGSLTDITARKEAEAEKAQVEAMLLQSQKLEGIGRLAGGVAHDFNNILAVITGFGELIRESLDKGHAARPWLKQVIAAAERAGDLTKQLLAFSRKQVMRPRPLDLNKVVKNLETMLTRLLGEDIEIDVQEGANLGVVMADPAQLEQVLVNLAVNARDAMPTGGRLTIETANAEFDQAYAAAHPPSTPGPFVMVAVTDTGSGIDAATQARIFEPFFTTKPVGLGTGLGLATVYGIVKQSGGYIWVYSEVGKGTTFKIYLPRVDVASEPEVEAVPTTAPLTGDETVLVVEDTESLRLLIRRLLENRGYRVLTASNGEEALALAEQRGDPIDLLLTDVVMPKLGGRDLAERLLSVRPETRVLFMSGYTAGAISGQGALPEGSVALEKPFNSELLARAVRNALDRPARE